MTRSEEIIWLAALLDGEGSFTQEKRRPHNKLRPRVALRMTDFDVVERASQIFKSNAVISKMYTENKTLYVYRWNGEIAENLMLAIAPYMSQRRHEKIEKILNQKIETKTLDGKELLVWVSGIFEGEICYNVKTDSRKETFRDCLRVTLKMSDKDVLERAVQCFPTKGTVRRSRPPSLKDHHKTMFIVDWNGASAEKVMRAVLPYMGTRRAAKIRECLKTPNLSHRKATA